MQASPGAAHGAWVTHPCDTLLPVVCTHAPTCTAGQLVLSNGTCAPRLLSPGAVLVASAAPVAATDVVEVAVTVSAPHGPTGVLAHNVTVVDGALLSGAFALVSVTVDGVAVWSTDSAPRRRPDVVANIGDLASDAMAVVRYRMALTTAVEAGAVQSLDLAAQFVGGGYLYTVHAPSNPVVVVQHPSVSVDVQSTAVVPGETVEVSVNVTMPAGTASEAVLTVMSAPDGALAFAGPVAARASAAVIPVNASWGDVAAAAVVAPGTATLP